MCLREQFLIHLRTLGSALSVEEVLLHLESCDHLTLFRYSILICFLCFPSLYWYQHSFFSPSSLVVVAAAISNFPSLSLFVYKTVVDVVSVVVANKHCQKIMVNKDAKYNNNVFVIVFVVVVVVVVVIVSGLLL